MPDGLHPNAAGLKLIAKCLTPLINRLIPSNSTQPSVSDISAFGSVTQSRGGHTDILSLCLSQQDPKFSLHCKFAESNLLSPISFVFRTGLTSTCILCAGSSANTSMALDDQAYSAPGYVTAAAKASLQAQQAVP